MNTNYYITDEEYEKYIKNVKEMESLIKLATQNYKKIECIKISNTNHLNRKKSHSFFLLKK